MNNDRLCCYHERLCNKPVVEETGYCEMHIMNSRFADDLGYKQCVFQLTKPSGNVKRCHRPVKVAKNKESGYCGRHQKRQKLERDPIDTFNNKHRRLEDCFNDIPDSDPDSDDLDHPLEKAGVLSEREINEILAVKIKKLKELYKAELISVNNDLIREERNDSKNIQFHFLKQSLMGNELLVAQMAKARQQEMHFKQKKDDRQSTFRKCMSDQDCWKHALHELNYCRKHASEQKNQFLYSEIPRNFQSVSDEISIEERKKGWSQISQNIKFDKTVSVLSGHVSSAVSSRASTPVHQTQVLYQGESSEELTRPNTPNPIKIEEKPSIPSGESLTLAPCGLERVSEESQSKLILSEAESSDDEKEDVIRGEFVPGGAGDVIDLGGFMYNITADEPMGQEVINLGLNKRVTATQLTPQPTQTHFAFIQQGNQSIYQQPTSSQQMIGIPVSLAAGNIQGIGPSTSQPIVSSSLPACQKKPIASRNHWQQKTQKTVHKQPINRIIRKYDEPNYIQSNMISAQMTPIAPNPSTSGSIITNQTIIKTQDGQMLIPIQASIAPGGSQQTQLGQNIAKTTQQYVTTSASHLTHAQSVPIQTTPVPKSKTPTQQPVPRNLKMVSIDFFGAQEKRRKSIAPSSASNKNRNSALEKLARKAEEAERAQAQQTVIQVPQASAIKILQIPQTTQPSPINQTGKQLKIINRKLGGSLSTPHIEPSQLEEEKSSNENQSSTETKSSLDELMDTLEDRDHPN